ncbi:hypothetical protein FN846DRAFT_894468 [Sphaerosporella brunnea]|uniref:Uncharacterized protein n=1 Tax=Sphaerosporella brunnea TaxID=1250544 RepID=A0A5J5EJ86_9PEZI|nr:hypothetical protein FN846DRAFT_894468 [Sphaerosporella brunnea]
MNGKTTAQQDCEAQQLVHHGDVAAASPEQIDSLSYRLGAMRSGPHMILFYYLGVDAHAPKLQPFPVPNPDQQLLAATFATLRGCAVFRAASEGVNRRTPKPIRFDHTRTVDVSCSFVEDPQAVPLQLRLLPCAIGLGPAAKENTNALMQVLFCVPELRRLLQPDLEVSKATIRSLDNLDAARDTGEMERIQTMLLGQFTQCDDDVRTVLITMNCPDSICTTKTTWCAQHKRKRRQTRTRMVLRCKDKVHQVIAKAIAGSQKIFTVQCDTCGGVATQTATVKNRSNTADGILLVQPSAGHPVTDVDEDLRILEAVHWPSSSRKIFFRRWRRLPSIPPTCAPSVRLISSSQDNSVEGFYANETPVLLFYSLDALDGEEPVVAAMGAAPQGVQAAQGRVVAQDRHLQTLQAAQGPILVEDAHRQHLVQGPVAGQDPHCAQLVQGPMLVQHPVPQALPVAPRPIGVLRQLEVATQRMERTHIGRLPVDLVLVTVILHREWAGEIDTIETSVHLSRFRDDDSTQLMCHVLSVLGLYFGVMVFSHGVCTLDNGLRVPIWPGFAHQKYVNSIASLQINVTRKEEN